MTSAIYDFLPPGEWRTWEDTTGTTWITRLDDVRPVRREAIRAVKLLCSPDAMTDAVLRAIARLCVRELPPPVVLP